MCWLFQIEYGLVRNPSFADSHIGSTTCRSCAHYLFRQLVLPQWKGNCPTIERCLALCPLVLVEKWSEEFDERWSRLLYVLKRSAHHWKRVLPSGMYPIKKPSEENLDSRFFSGRRSHRRASNIGQTSQLLEHVDTYTDSFPFSFLLRSSILWDPSNK